jgi:hypothetical protein
MLRVLPVLLLACASGPAAAAVKDSAPGGFTVVLEATVAAAPQVAWEAAVRNIGKWWDPEHSYSGVAANLSIDARPGGCFCEQLADGGGVQHLAVAYVQPGRVLRMLGGLGPLQGLGLGGALTWDFEAAGPQTRIRWTYRVAGYDPGGLEAWAPRVDGMLAGQLQRLAKFIEASPSARGTDARK